jgi:hypothetical protein
MFSPTLHLAAAAGIALVAVLFAGPATGADVRPGSLGLRSFSGAAVGNVSSSPPPSTLPTSVTVAMAASLCVVGDRFGPLVNGTAAAHRQLVTAVTTDLGTLLGIDASHVHVTNMYESNGTLAVHFSTAAAAGVQAGELVRRLALATESTVWLANTQALHSILSPATLSVTQPPAATTSAPLAAPITTPPPSTLPGSVTAAVRASLRINGDSFGPLLSGTAGSRLHEAVRRDLSTLLGVDESSIFITNMYLGSLVVEFSVSTAASALPDELVRRVGLARDDAAWLSTTQALYSTVAVGQLGVIEAPVAVAVSAASTPTTMAPPTIPPPSTLPASFVAAISATIRFSGTAFAALLLNGNREQRASLFTAVATDLGTLLGIDASYVFITNMYLSGTSSLTVEFSVATDANVYPSELSQRLSMATRGTAWLASLQGVYGTVSEERVAVTEAPFVTAAVWVSTPPPQGPSFADSPAATVASMAACAVGAVVVAVAAAVA